MRVLIIADDLTGALDSAVALTGAGLRCLVARRPGDVAAAIAAAPEVLAVNTASREGDAAAAAAAVRAAMAAVADAGMRPEVLFKKVDSRLKGHVAAEVAALGSGHARALVAPAIPAQGRSVAGGRLVGAGVRVPVDVAGALAGSGLEAVVPDTPDDAALDAALAEAFAGPVPLLVGAAGLAGALARRLRPGARPVAAAAAEAPLLLAIGSRDPITLAQVEMLAAVPGLATAAAPDGACPPAPPPGRAVLLRLVAGEGVFDPGPAGTRFAAGVAAWLEAGGFRTLLACGGETADAILGAIGEGVLAIEGEALPGVPVSRMLRRGEGLRLVTKSGGFGAPDALARIVAAAPAGSLEGAR